MRTKRKKSKTNERTNAFYSRAEIALNLRLTHSFVRRLMGIRIPKLMLNLPAAEEKEGVGGRPPTP